MLINCIILYSVSMSFFIKYFINLKSIHKIFNRRPFTCTTCLSFWVSIGLSTYSSLYFEAIFIGSVSMLLTYILELFLNKYL